MQYMNFWNMGQVLTLVLVLLFVIFNIMDMIAGNGASIVLVQYKWLEGRVQIFTLINFLYCFRGFKTFSWFLYALTILTNKM